jgi:hypothetical protein
MTIFLSSSEQIRTYILRPSLLFTTHALYVQGHEYGTGSGELEAGDLNRSGSALVREITRKSSLTISTRYIKPRYMKIRKGEMSLHFLAFDLRSCIKKL